MIFFKIDERSDSTIFKLIFTAVHFIPLLIDCLVNSLNN